MPAHDRTGARARARVREARRVLLYRLLAPWRRRGATLLQVGLRSGLMPDFFWDAGFDVTGLDGDSAVRHAAELTGPRVDYAVGRPDSLPFDDGAYDHVVLVHLDVRSADVLHEALRVAARGVLLIEWNRFALGGPGRHGHGCWPWSLMWLAFRACADRPVTMASVLPFPPRARGFSWHEIDVPPEDPGSLMARQATPPLSPSPQSATSPLGRAARGAGGRTSEAPPPSRQEQACGPRTRPEDMEDRSAGMAKKRPDAPRSFAGWLDRLVFPFPVGAMLGLRLEKSPLLMTPAGTVTVGPSARPCAADAVVSRVDGAEEGNLARRSAARPETD